MTWNLKIIALQLSLLIAVIFVLSTDSNGAPARPGKINIVKIIDTAGTLRFEVVEADLVTYLKKEVNTEYKNAKSAWHKARADWEEKNNAKKFPCPEPVKPEIKVVGKGFQDQNDAREEVESLQSKGPYCVVQVIVGKEKMAAEIVQTDEVKKIKYDLEMSYFESVKAWNDEKSAFDQSQAGGEFKKLMPEKSQLKVLKKRLKTLEKAEAALEKYSK